MELTALQEAQFNKYYGLLVEWNRVMNLTAITDADEVRVKHFEDSLTLVPYLDRLEARSLIDVGTGAGFPGIPLKIVRPELKVVLLDSLRKRVDFLNAVIHELGLEGIEAVHARAEDAGRDKRFRGEFDCASARAVAEMRVLMEYCMPFVRVGGSFLAMKGPAEEEYGKALKVLRGSIVSDDVFVLSKAGRGEYFPENTLGEGQFVRRIICVSKDGETPGQYPRKAGLPARKPL